MQLSETIYIRRSIHEFEKYEMSIQEVNEILKAGTYAPSAKNRQPWFFNILCDDQPKTEFIESMKNGILKLEQRYQQKQIPRPDIEGAKGTLKCMGNASVIILVSCQKKYTNIYEDGVSWSLSAKDIEVTDILSIGAAIQNILLKATDMGYGTLWVCDIFYAYPQIVEFLQTKDDIISAVCIGKTKHYPHNFSRLPLEKVSSVIQSKEKSRAYEPYILDGNTKI